MEKQKAQKRVEQRDARAQEIKDGLLATIPPQKESSEEIKKEPEKEVEKEPAEEIKKEVKEKPKKKTDKQVSLFNF